MTTAVLPTTGLSTQNPWPGLRAFTESDHDFFFGRERETGELFNIVKRSSVAVLYGQSGLGKTSLLQAGLFPELKKIDVLPLRVRFDHSDNAPALAQQIKQALTSALDRTGVDAPRPAANETLWEYFHRRDVDFWGQRNRLLTPLIVIDQFEEVFTLGQKNEKTASRVAEFTAELESLIEHRAPDKVREYLDQRPDDALAYDIQRQSVKILVSLREDFLPHLDSWRARMPSLLQQRFRLERMTGAQALTVVMRAGSELVQPEIAQDIVDFVSTSQRNRRSRSLEQRDVEPALLSVVCDELNRRRIERGQAQITGDLLTVEREGIIKSFYERAFEDLDPRVEAWVEDELLTASGYRDRAAMEDALKQGLPESAFDLLVDRRILHREERQGVIWLELTHDLLTDPASQDRTARQAKAAAKRESEIARRRGWIATFAVLFLGLVAVVIYNSILKSRAIEDAQHEQTKAQRDREAARSQEEKAIRASAAAAQANAEAAGNFKRLIESRSEILAENARGDMRIPTKIIRRVIDDSDKDFEALGKLDASNQSAPNADLATLQAKFLVESAEALRMTGDFTQATKKADSALQKLDATANLPQAESVRDTLQIVRAQALLVRGECRFTTGDLGGAKLDLLQSARLAGGTTSSSLKPDEDRVLVLSAIYLGDVNVRAADLATASHYFDHALQLIKTLPNKEESSLWRVMALEGMALSQKKDDESERWMDDAANVLGADSTTDAANLRRKRLFAEIAYQRAYVANGLDKGDVAYDLFQQASAASDELNKIDPDNLDWSLSQVQSWRGLGTIYLQRGEWDQARKNLEEAEDQAAKLIKLQPAWVQASFLRANALLSLGRLMERRYSGSRDTKDLQPALDHYAEARQCLQEAVRTTPRNIALLAKIIASQGNIYYSLGDAAANENAKVDAFNKALQFYEEARKALAPVQANEQEAIADYDNSSGSVLVDLEKPAEAISFYEKAINIQLDLLRKSPDADSWSSLAGDRRGLGNAYARNKENSKALAAYVQAAKDIDQALAIRPHDIGFLREKANIHAAQFDTLKSQGQLSEALDEMDVAAKTVWSGLEEDDSNQPLIEDITRYRRIAEKTAAQLEDISKPAQSSSQSAADPKVPNPRESAELAARIREMLARTDPAKLMQHNQQHAWSMAPIVPGAWRTLESGELKAARSQLLAAKPSLKSGQVRGIRKLPVDFYSNAALFEAEIRQENGVPGIISYLQRGDKTVVLDGLRQRILSVNEETPPRLDTIERATAYLRFWMGSIESEEGCFKLIDQLQDLQWSSSATAGARSEASEEIKPLTVQAASGGGWRGIGTLQVAQQLVYATIRLDRNGLVRLPNFAIAQASTESPLGVPQTSRPSTGEKGIKGLEVEGFLKGVRGPFTDEMALEYLEANPNSDDAIKELPGRYAHLKRWEDAARAQQKLLDSVRAESKTNPDKAKIVDAYTDLAWYQLRTADFKDALASAEEAKKLDESSIAADAYRAGALLFLGQKDEADAIYDKLSATPKALAVFQDRVNLSTELKRWSEAVVAQKKIVALLEAREKTDDDRRKTLPNSYLSLSWYQLLAGDYDGALASSEAGRKIDPSSLSLETNHAHSLMFLNRTQEAEDLYLKYRGKQVSELSGKIWEQVILEDFSDLEKEGRKNPEMEHIREMFKPGPK